MGEHASSRERGDAEAALAAVMARYCAGAAAAYPRVPDRPGGRQGDGRGSASAHIHETSPVPRGVCEGCQPRPLAIHDRLPHLSGRAAAAQATLPDPLRLAVLPTMTLGHSTAVAAASAVTTGGAIMVRAHRGYVALR